MFATECDELPVPLNVFKSNQLRESISDKAKSIKGTHSWDSVYVLSVPNFISFRVWSTNRPLGLMHNKGFIVGIWPYAIVGTG